VDGLGIAAGYYVTVAIVKVGDRVVLPHEVKILPEYGNEVVFILKSTYGAIRLGILGIVYLLETGSPGLAEATQYLLDGYHRYLDGDLEGAVTQLRKSVQVLKDKVLVKIKELEGIKSLKRYSEDFAEHLDSMLGNLQDLFKATYYMLSIGGPHPGPVPRETAVFAFKVVLSFIEYLSKCLSLKTKLRYE